MHGTQTEHSQSQESVLAEVHQLTAPPGSKSGVFLLPAEVHVCLPPNCSGNLTSERVDSG